MRAVKLSLFTEVQCPPATSPEQRLAELLEQAELADRLGFHTLWISEIHFQPEFSALAVCTCATDASTLTVSPTAPMVSFSSPTSSRPFGVRTLPML